MQMEARSSTGLRLNVADVRDRPWLLDILGRLEAFPSSSAKTTWRKLRRPLKYLDANPADWPWQAFRRAEDPAALSRPGAVEDLFSHPGFVVVMS